MRYHTRASFRGLHPGTDRRCSRLPYSNWPRTPRIITQVTCVKANVEFFDRRLDGETPRTKRLWVYALGEKKGEVVALQLCSVLYSAQGRICLSEDRGATARLAS